MEQTTAGVMQEKPHHYLSGIGYGKIATAGGLLLVVGSVIGGFLVFSLDSHLPEGYSNTKKGYTSGYQIGFATSKKLVEESAMGDFFRTHVISETFSITGKITAIEGNVMTVNMRLLNPYDNLEMSNRKVLIASTTKFMTVRKKAEEAFVREKIAFAKTLAASSTYKESQQDDESFLPQQFVQMTVSSSTLKVGDTVSVIANENIRDSQTFNASKVQIIIGDWGVGAK